MVFVLLFSVASFYSCEKLNAVDPELQMIKDFVSSKEFKRIEKLSMSTVDYKKSKVVYVNNDVSRPVLNVLLMKEGKVQGVVEAIKNINKNILLPNQDTYFMLYRDLRKFDLKSQSGVVSLIDLNYDNHVFHLLEYKAGKNILSEFKPLAIELREKYQKIANSNSNYFSLKSQSRNVFLNKEMNTSNDRISVIEKKIPCDMDRDGNLSYSECYQCLNGSCMLNSECYLLCYGIGDVAGWVIIGFPQCQVSIAASCIYLSIEY